MYGKQREWFSLELPTAQKVTKVQIARRMGSCCWHQGQNIKITIGPSKSYDPNEPTCLPEITDLTRAKGLEDYVCTDDPPPGKFVKLSKKGVLVLCEVKVFAIQDSEYAKWKEAEDKKKSGGKAKKGAEAEKARKIAEAKKKAAEAEQAKMMAEAKKRAEESRKRHEKHLEYLKKKEDEKRRAEAAEKAKKIAKSKKKDTEVAHDKRDGGIGCYKIRGNNIAKYLENADSPKS